MDLDLDQDGQDDDDADGHRRNQRPPGLAPNRDRKWLPGADVDLHRLESYRSDGSGVGPNA